MNRKIVLAILLLLGVALSLWQITKNNRTKTSTDQPTASLDNRSDIPNDWNTYQSSLNYSISYPDNYVIEPNGDYSILIYKPMKEPGFGPANFVYVSIVQPNMLDSEGEIYNYNPDWFNKLNEMDIGESRSLADPADLPVFDEVMTFTRVDDITIDGYTVKRFENNQPWEFPTGTTDVRHILEKDGYIYILGYYYGGEGVADTIDASEAFKLVSTFSLNK